MTADETLIQTTGTGIADDVMERAPARKDTRTWCKGKEGREHKPHIIKSNYARNWECKPTAWGQNCYHVYACEVCGKQLRDMKKDECPTMHPELYP